MCVMLSTLESYRRNWVGSHLSILREGIEEMVKWYLDNREWMDHVTSGEYQKYFENIKIDNDKSHYGYNGFG